MARAGLTYYRFIFLPAALGLLLPSLIMPWVVINFLGSSLFSPIDIIGTFYWQDSSRLSSNSAQRFDLYDLLSSYGDSFGASVASMVLYVSSIVGVISAIMFKAHRSRLVISAAFLAILSSALWLYSIESLKSSFSQQAAITGGIVGEEFRGHERALADIIIGVGFGPYVALAGGAVGILSYVSEKAANKTN